MGIVGRIPAYLIAGHHAGLPDFESAEQGGSTLFDRYMVGVEERVAQEGTVSPVNQARAAVLRQCRAKAMLPKSGRSLEML